MAIDYTDHANNLVLLKQEQEDDSDNRDRVRESHHFLDKRDGQWEPSIVQQMTSRPRYTFDKCNPVVDDIAGEMEQADFDIRVRPAGGQATKDVAKVYDGLIRNIENISNATHVFNSAGRDMVASGLGGWEVVQDWADTDSFEQDLFIRPISNFEDRVWFDSASELQDRSDARHCWVLQNLTPDEYESKFPDGSKQSISSDKKSEAYQNKSEFITVGRLLYREEVKKTLHLMSDGSIYEDGEDFNKVKDELAEQGITVEKTRERDSFQVKSRLFDGGGWLNEPEDTVFQWLPIIPSYGNFKIRESKVIYRGAIEKLMDGQRVYNYARSREIEEVALAPRAKFWMTRKQAGNPADQRKIQTLNTNADPVQFFEPDDRLPGIPQQSGGAAVNPGLQTVVQNSLDDIATSSGRLSVQGGDTDGPLSGVAIQKLQNKGDNSSIKYFKSQEVAICHTGRIIINALPKVYDTKRQARVLNEDNSFEMVTINDEVFDQETQKMITLNDLSQGKYDVTCDVGPAFKNRQQESVKALQELSAVIPGLAEITADIQMNNIASPGVDMAAERIRRRLFEAGQIPESQMTDEEKEEIQLAQQQAALEAQQGQQPTPQDLIAQAEVERVQAETADIISKAQERSDKTQLSAQQMLLKEQEQLFRAQDAAEKRDIQELRLAMDQQAQQAQQQQALLQAQLEGQKAIIQNLNTQAQTLKTLREAMGVQTIVGPHATEAYIQQAETITDQQDQIQLTPETDSVTGAPDDQ
jgi:hypothetical protein